MPQAVNMQGMTAHPSSPPQASQPGQRPDQRLAKRVAELRSCSRSEAEQYIAGGWVRVDGQVVEEPQFRVMNQKVEIDSQASLMTMTDVTLVFNKPPGIDARSADRLLTAASHMAQDASGQRFLKRHLLKLICPVPLETGASGLLVFTQDWRVERKLVEDANSMEHEVIVEVAGEVPDDALRRLNHRIGADGSELPQVKVSINSSGDNKAKLRFAIKGTHPGLIAWLCERASLKILGMKRIRLGRVAISSLPIGQWRYLAPHERF
jgi:23S rRNA pseudouridine2604 synthase